MINCTTQSQLESVNHSQVDNEFINDFPKEYVNKFNRLEIEVPPILAKAIGYRGSARWVQFYWESEPVGKPVCHDGNYLYVGSKVAWEILLAYITYNSVSCHLSNDNICFLLDQQHQILYCAEPGSVIQLIQEPDSLKLLQWLNRKSGITRCHSLINTPLSRLIISIMLLTAMAVIVFERPRLLDSFGSWSSAGSVQLKQVPALDDDEIRVLKTQVALKNQQQQSSTTDDVIVCPLK